MKKGEWREEDCGEEDAALKRQSKGTAQAGKEEITSDDRESERGEN